MTVAYQSLSTVEAGSTSLISTSVPASMADGDLALMIVVTKPDTATIVTPTGWTQVANVAGGGGTTGNTVGPTRQAWFSRIKDASWSTAPTVTITNGNASAKVIARVTRSGGTGFDITAATGTYGDAATVTDCAATLGSDPGITSGDLLVCGYSSMDNLPTWSAQGASAPGVTIGAATERSEAIESSAGNNVGGMMFTASVTAGTSTGVPSTAATSSATNRGTVVLIRVREAAAGASLTGSPADPVAISDAPATVLDGTRAPADPVGTTDTAGTTVAAGRSHGDAVGVTDSVAAVLSVAYDRTPADPEAITDTTATTLAATRAPADPVGVTDSASAVLTSGVTRTQPDTVGITDAVTAQLDRVVTVDDLLDLIDAPAPTAIRPRTSGDTVGTTDAVTVTLERVVDVADVVGILDAATPTAAELEPPTPQRRIVSAVLTIPTLAADLEVPGSIAATITARAVRADLTIPEARGVLT